MPSPRALLPLLAALFLFKGRRLQWGKYHEAHDPRRATGREISPHDAHPARMWLNDAQERVLKQREPITRKTRALFGFIPPSDLRDVRACARRALRRKRGV